MPQEIDYTSYNVPGGDSKFLKLENGDTRIRICSKPYEVIYHDTTVGGKYSTSYCTGDKCEHCKKGLLKKFKYGFIVLHRVSPKENAVAILEAPKTMFRQILAYATNPEYGNPEMYDLTINRAGEKPQITYTVIASPKVSELTTEEAELLLVAGLNLANFYSQAKK